jgi:diadenosine hexaphosphate hydrolase (ATP-forming)
METEVCAGGIVLGDAGTVALVRNRKETLWFFPKGHVDDGESLEEAARREIMEETGLTSLELLDTLGSYTRPKIEKDGSLSTTVEKEIHMFLFSAEQHATLTPSMEIVDATWCALPHVIHQLENAKDKTWFTTVFERVRQAIQRD